MNTDKYIDSLSNIEIVRLILNRIWIRWDARGISLDRTLRAGLLERILCLIPKPDPLIDLELEDYLENLSKRESMKWNGELLLKNLPINALPTQYLVLFLFREIERWYEHDSRTSEYPLDVERKNINKIGVFIGVDEHLQQFEGSNVNFTPMELIQEVDERQRIRHLFEMNCRPF